MRAAVFTRHFFGEREVPRTTSFGEPSRGPAPLIHRRVSTLVRSIGFATLSRQQPGSALELMRPWIFGLRGCALYRACRSRGVLVHRRPCRRWQRKTDGSLDAAKRALIRAW